MFKFSHSEHSNTPLLSQNAHAALAFKYTWQRLSSGAEAVVICAAKYRLLLTQEDLEELKIKSSTG